MWKLNKDLPQYAKYLSYIRPQLEYASAVYNNCTQEQSNKLEACWRRAEWIFIGTSTARLLKELGWSWLENGRTYFSEILLFKITNNLAPSYPRILFPCQHLGWSRLENRRTYFSEILLFKITNNLAPSYPIILLPCQHGENVNYPSRRETFFIPLTVNTKKCSRALIWTSVRTWNNLNSTVR